MTGMTADRLVTFTEAAEMLGRVSIRTVRRLIASGELPKPVYIGRIPKLSFQELASVIERLKQQRKQTI
ncbi:MAG: helix-turn-helix domain-containing protein [Chthoniobacterales bacterium]|nr:helix-turn-helix domain-containing protein [Chthoniobacterales bacterium]